MPHSLLSASSRSSLGDADGPPSTGRGGSGGDGAGRPNGSGPPQSPFSRGTGEGVDRKLEKQRFTPKRIGLGLLALVLVAGLGYGVWSSATGGQALNVERDKLTISTVERAPFQEFIAVTGNVLPERTVFLDAVEGGRVEQVYVEEGAMVRAGEPLLRLSNNDLQLRLMNNEAQLAEQESNLQQLRFNIAQNRLDLRQQLAQLDFDITRLAREHRRNARLHAKKLIAREEYQATRDELQYLRGRRELTQRAFEQDSLAQETQMRQMEMSVQRMRRNFGVLEETLANLTVRAPISGQLTALDAEVGEIRASGSRFGQIDKLDAYKIRAPIDEFYIERVTRGQTATTQALGGTEYALRVTRVYPEVENGRFEVDLAFAGDATPASIRRGQSVRLRLELGSPEQALLLDRGGFYQSTGGNWAYVVADGSDEAVRQPIRLGRQNPNHFEVLEGLEPGDRVVTSGYDTFGDADRLVLQ
jgi:HlyD family secretion protein